MLEALFIKESLPLRLEWIKKNQYGHLFLKEDPVFFF